MSRRDNRHSESWFVVFRCAASPQSSSTGCVEPHIPAVSAGWCPQAGHRDPVLQYSAADPRPPRTATASARHLCSGPSAGCATPWAALRIGRRAPSARRVPALRVPAWHSSTTVCPGVYPVQHAVAGDLTRGGHRPADARRPAEREIPRRDEVCSLLLCAGGVGAASGTGGIRPIGRRHRGTIDARTRQLGRRIPVVVGAGLVGTITIASATVCSSRWA